MLAVKLAPSRALRRCLLGVATVSFYPLPQQIPPTHAAITAATMRLPETPTAPPSSIIVDANSGNTLQATSADSQRHRHHQNYDAVSAVRSVWRAARSSSIDNGCLGETHRSRHRLSSACNRANAARRGRDQGTYDAFCQRHSGRSRNRSAAAKSPLPRR